MKITKNVEITKKKNTNMDEKSENILENNLNNYRYVRKQEKNKITKKIIITIKKIS